MLVQVEAEPGTGPNNSNYNNASDYRDFTSLVPMEAQAPLRFESDSSSGSESGRESWRM